MTRPLAPTKLPGLDRIDFVAYTPSGVSPRTVDFQLPTYGAWLLTLWAWYGNPNNSIIRPYLTTWYRHDPASTTDRKNLALSAPLAAAAPATDGSSGAANTLTDISLSAPGPTGLVTATVTWTGGDSKTPRVHLVGRQIRGLLDWNAG